MTADDVLNVQFTHIRKGGYDTQEVDAFLDRVAQTLDVNADRLPVGSMTGADVRAVQFTQVKKGGYDTQEVDNFLDQVVALMTAPVRPAPPVDAAPDGSASVPASAGAVDLGFDDLVGEPPAAVAPTPIPVTEPAPSPVAPAPTPVAQPVQAADPVVASAPQLHDPGGAAQKLLAAAQQTADILTVEAETAKREADEYALATRTEADEHAARVTATAETQAAAIREVAAEEARRMAEEARAAVVDDIAALEAQKLELSGTISELESVVAAERSELLAAIDALRDRVAAELPSAANHAAPGDEFDDDAEIVESIEEEVDAAFSAEPLDTDMAPTEPAAVAAEPEPVAVEPEPVVDEPEPEPVAVEPEPVVEASEAVPDAAAEASRSVFDLVEDTAAEADTDWIDQDLPGTAEPTSEAASGSLFDIEADPDWQDAKGGTQPGGSGESFFDELRQADNEGGFGPLDDDTDAALSAFFEGDEPDSQNGRWRDRFGPTNS